ncbi:hypothetical protein GUJ93_ZPchr0008g13588 [Zizania palustris]|uniref:Uncharacterized protein n=1 Tax=Zizania palustris TaxID=103762 RepID=A0A8J5RIG9_ZIZPA|nr:hypothetical protein GUJ93_ZPchr0008g13588 [Zizania palustris]
MRARSNQHLAWACSEADASNNNRERDADPHAPVAGRAPSKQAENRWRAGSKESAMSRLMASAASGQAAETSKLVDGEEAGLASELLAGVGDDEVGLDALLAAGVVGDIATEPHREVVEAVLVVGADEHQVGAGATGDGEGEDEEHDEEVPAVACGG